MSVYDENRPWCLKCGKVIDTWRTTPCDDGTCMIDKKEIKADQNFLNPVDSQLKLESTEQHTGICCSRELRDHASTLLSNAVGDWIKDKNDMFLFKNIEYVKALRTAANHIDGI